MCCKCALFALTVPIPAAHSGCICIHCLCWHCSSDWVTLNCLYAHECQWCGIFWMLAVIFFFYPAPTQTHQLCFLKTGSQRKLWCTRTEWMLLPPTFKSSSASFLCEIFATLYTQEYVGMFVLEATTHSTTLD